MTSDNNTTSQTETKNTAVAGSKRRRGAEGGYDGLDDEKTAQTSKCKGATTIPIFLKSKFVGLLVCLQ